MDVFLKHGVHTKLYSVSVVYIGESTVEIKTEADSNDITETANLLHDKPSIGVFGFCVAIVCACIMCSQFALTLLLFLQYNLVPVREW